MTVVSNGSGVGGCGTLLVPLIHGNHGTAVFQPSASIATSTVITSSATSSDSIHLTTVGDSVLPVNINTSMSPKHSATTPNTAASFLVTTANAASVHSPASSVSGANGCKVVNSPLSNDHNGQHPVTTDSMDLKPEPMECLSSVTVSPVESGDSAMLTTSTELTSINFAQLPPLTPFVPQTTQACTSASISSTASITVSRSGMILNTACKTADVTSSSVAETSNSTSKTSPGNGPYRCRDCNKEFRILRYLEKHRRIHTGEKPYQCCYCGRQFNDWPNMNRHKRIHTGERPYRCAVCSKTFSQPAVYNEHVKRHTGERPYICVVCAKGFPRAARLAVHMRVHTGERPYPCTSCDRRFSQPHHLAAHLRVHSGDRPYTCPKCDVSFACISNLRRHRKQVHPTSPIPPDEAETTAGTVVDLGGEKKPTIQRLTTVVPASESISSNRDLAIDSNSLLATSSAMTADAPVALAAAMSGTLLTASGAFVPANLLPASSIPGLFLTSGSPGALLAAPAQFATDSQGQLQPTLIAHSSGLGADGSNTGLFTTTVTGCPVSFSQTSGTLNSVSDSLLKPGSSSTVSFMLPTVLTATSNSEGLRQTAVTFLTPTGELDRSCTNLTNTALAAAGHEGGGLVVNAANGETVYLEPLDPRVTFEHGHPFTLTTIPTSHPSGSTTILGPSSSGAHILGHQIHLQPGPHGTHFAFATNLPGNTQQLFAPGSTIFSTNTPSGQATMYTSQNPTAIIFPQPASLQQTPSSVSSQQPQQQQRQQQSVLQAAPAQVSTPQLLHYHRPPSTTGANSPGRPSSTPNQPQTSMLVPIIHTPPVNANTNTAATPTSSETLGGEPGTVSNPNWHMGNSFIALGSTHLSPSVTPSAVQQQQQHEEQQQHIESTTLTSSSRPSSTLSNSSSLGAITVTTVGEINL
ncbi:unnamed protein product [Calicophoron daubneyi]